MEEQREIQRQFRQQQEKYVYYLIALSVTAIGFSVYKTTGLKLMWIQLPLGISVACWGISVFCGLRFLKNIISSLYANNAYFDVMQGLDTDIGNNPLKMKVAIEGIGQAIEAIEKRTSKYFIWQERLFYSGIFLFIIWHVLEMYQAT